MVTEALRPDWVWRLGRRLLGSARATADASCGSFSSSIGSGPRMSSTIGNVSPVLCAVGLVQVLGIVAAIASRLAEG